MSGGRKISRWPKPCWRVPLFEAGDTARVFGLPPGVDFPRAVIAGLTERLSALPPEALARIELFVNTGRMQRRLRALFDAGPARLLPRIRLVTELADSALIGDIPPAASPLRRRLELTQLVARLLEKEPDLAPRAALFDLADSLAGLMDEMRGEGVSPGAIQALDLSDQSGHWQRSLQFITLIERFFGDDAAELDVEARQRLVVEALSESWETSPPTHPVIVAGSTGSRGATALFMRAVARLPQGAVILPGVDFDMPRAVWDRLDTAASCEDHPQYRFARLMRDLGGHPGDIRRWRDDPPPCPARNRLFSLALRPAPVTDQWLSEGKRLTDIPEATRQVSLIEAASSRIEATAIALALRQAVEDGRVAALITPDRNLTRQVSAALDRWGIVPDDSAGRPLPLSAPGRLLRHVAGLFGATLTVEDLLAVLKHPLCGGSGEARGAHLLLTRELELHLRRHGPPFPRPADILAWSGKDPSTRADWAEWLTGLIGGLDNIGARSLSEHLAHHVDLTERFAGGVAGTDAGELWQAEAGAEARRWIDELRREAAFGGVLSTFEYASLLHSVLQRGEVREAVVAHPDVMIWGTLEARVQGAELVILAGLNEGVWPEIAPPDPWLNRQLREQAGLLLPERRIGLAAHDFQQAVAASEVILTRSIRDAEAQTVASRWVNRLCNLLRGLPGDGAEALEDMRRRGARWLSLAEAVQAPDRPVPPAPRPSPQPPVEVRPDEISITEVQRLIRDPYAVYARRLLRLHPLDPLRRLPNAPLRGILLHEMLERFIDEAPVAEFETDKARLIRIVEEVLERNAPWPAAQRLWRARMLRVVDWFVQSEIERQATDRPVALEAEARMTLPELRMDLYGKLDRIDRAPDQRWVVYDYKAGKPPGEGEREHFDKQLMLSALLAEAGAVQNLPAASVAAAGYIGFGSGGVLDVHPLDDGATGVVRARLIDLLAAYKMRERGYTSRRAPRKREDQGDYDHLARYGEWDESAAPQGTPVG